MKVKNNTIINTPQQFRNWIKPYIAVLDEGYNAFESGNSASKKVRSLNRTLSSSNKNKFEADCFDTKTADTVRDVFYLFNELNVKLMSMKRYWYLKAVEGPLNGVLKRTSSGALEFLHKNGNTLNIYSRPDENLFRIFVKDKENKVIRGYLIEDCDKMISNYNILQPNKTPHVPIYSSKDKLDKVAIPLNDDLSFAKNILKTVKEITKNLKVNSKQ